MDSFDLELLQEWDLDDICGYDQDKNVLRWKELERRNQELQKSEDSFHTNYHLFREPYKTSKGDELSSRIQNTLGNYDEMKDFLIDYSNQNNLVGIPKTETVDITAVKIDEHFLQKSLDSQYTLCGTVLPCTTSGTLPEQLDKGITMNWQKPGHSTEEPESITKADQRISGSPNSDYKTGHQKRVMATNSYSLSPSSSTSTSNDSQQNVLISMAGDALRRQKQHATLTCNLDLGVSLKKRTCSKIDNNANCVQSFPSSLPSKMNSGQQKPTAYVRPMDGQDQAPNESPKLKSLTENNVLFPLFRGISKIGMSDTDQAQADQHINIGLKIQKHSDLPVRSPTNCTAQISMLEDDLRLSSDDEDSAQAPQGQAISVQSDSGDAQQCNNRTSGVSIKGESSSSSESDSSSGSDSESESTSSESEQNKPSGYTSPEPEHSTANKWQLDKWLNKVNPNRSCILSHTYGLCHTGIKEVGKSSEKVSDDSPPSPADKKIQSLSREEQKLPTACVASGNKGVKQKSSAPIALVATVLDAVPSENKSRKRPICRQLTRRTERTSSGDNVYCHSSDNAFLNQGILGNNISEQPKTNLHRKEARTGLVGCEIRRTRALNKFFLKTKEFESSSHYSDHGTETELEVSPLSKNVSDTPVIARENNHRLKESENNNTGRSNQSSDTGFVNARTTELEEQYYTLVPFGRNENINSLKGSGATKSLWVRIDLSLLSRIPVGPCQETCTMNTNMKEPCSSPQNRDSSEITDTALLKSRRKRKSENGRSQHMKKKYLEKEEYSQMASSLDQFDMANAHSTHINSLAIAMTKSETLLLSPTSPLPDVSKHKCTNDGLSGSKINCGYVLSASRNRRTENQSHQRSVPIPSENSTGSNAGDLPSNAWSHISNGHKESRRSKSLIGRTPRDADYFMQEAKRMKHKADAMMDKSEKMMNYTEAALSFIECGNAMEHGPMESKSPYTMYSETVDLIRYALRLKSHSGPSSSSQDKKITALCYRCLALLYWRMFRLKKDHAVKYSKALIDYFKNTSKVHQVPSSRCANGKTTGTPSPLSPSPSPVSSVGSQGSISSAGGPSNTSIISIPQRIHQMAANHVSITNSILHSYDYWEIADNLAKDNIDFFNKLDALMGPVTLHSSMEHLVQYTRQGLRWVRYSTQML